MTLRAFARHLGVTNKPVRKAIATGRVHGAAVGQDASGSPFIADAELAAQQWVENATKARPLTEAPTARRFAWTVLVRCDVDGLDGLAVTGDDLGLLEKGIGVLVRGTVREMEREERERRGTA